VRASRSPRPLFLTMYLYIYNLHRTLRTAFYSCAVLWQRTGLSRMLDRCFCKPSFGFGGLRCCGLSLYCFHIQEHHVAAVPTLEFVQPGVNCCLPNPAKLASKEA
jgi:hypothetical protein